MARKPQQEKPAGTNREKIVSAFLALLAERRIEEISFSDVAERAGLSLADCRGEFNALPAVLGAYVKDIDRRVLAGGDADMAAEPPRERLFDVLMRRLEALAPQRAAVRSMQWMLTAADMDAGGPRGMLRAQGLALLYASVLRTWVDDEDPGQART